MIAYIKNINTFFSICQSRKIKNLFCLYLTTQHNINLGSNATLVTIKEKGITLLFAPNSL